MAHTHAHAPLSARALRYSLAATFAYVLITLFAGMIIPDSVRPQYVDNLLGGLTMHLAGPPLLRLAN